VVWTVVAVCGGDELTNVTYPEYTNDDANDDSKAMVEEGGALASRPGHFGPRRSIDFLLNLVSFIFEKVKE